MYAYFLNNPFPSDHFDLIYLHNVPILDVADAVPEFTRVLRPGGHVIIGYSPENPLPNQTGVANEFLLEKIYKDVTPKEFKDPAFTEEFYRLETDGTKSFTTYGQQFFVLEKLVS